MRIITNESHIKTRTQIGERAPFVGLIMLAAATLFIFWKPELFWATMILVWVGFAVSLTGSYLGDRYVGPLAHYKKVPEALKGLDNRYVLLMYKTPLPFVLLDPGGVTVITVKSQGGVIRYQDGKWHHREKMGFLRRMAGQENVGRAHRMAQSAVVEMQQFLNKKLPEDIDVPVRPVLLFINSNVELDAEDSPVPALRLAQLKRWLRKDGRWSKLPDETVQCLAEALGVE